MIPMTVVHWGVPIAVIVALVAWFIMSRSVFGYQVQVVGAAPDAARYGGFSEKRTIWLTLLVSGALAGLAGALEVAGPFQRMVPGFPTSYGFTAIIVAFLGRLNPLGVPHRRASSSRSPSSAARWRRQSIGLPKAATGIFQALMLFFLLAGDILVRYRVRRVVAQPAVEARP